MTENRLWVAGALVALMAAAGGGYFLGRNHEGNQIASVPAPREASAPKPLYYQDPDGKPVYSPTPKKTVDGRDFKPVYAEGASSHSSSVTRQRVTRGRILYYRNPMGLADISRTPKKDSMGMDYIPVHEGE